MKTKQVLSAKLEAYGVNELFFEPEAFLHTQQHPGSSATFPTALKAFIKGFFSGSMKSEDFPELSFGPIDGTLIFGNLKHTDAARLSFMFYMLRQE